MSRFLRLIGLACAVQILFLQAPAMAAERFGYVYNAGTNTYAVIDLTTNTTLLDAIPANWGVMLYGSMVYFISIDPNAAEHPTYAVSTVNAGTYSTVTAVYQPTLLASDIDTVLSYLNSYSGGSGGGGSGGGGTSAVPALPAWAALLLAAWLARAAAHGLRRSAVRS